ncbi:MAG: hypothetical protein A4S12_11060 [Proteobacteria bacterium SG_bin5]|nr:MAG: hypothetical protein A4S12_11060 [Proteobacteria bacterium SG_bin5]
MIDAYDWRGGREALLRFGPPGAPVVMLLLPLFEEHNRVRALGVGLLRALAARGIAGALPELPGQGESLVPTELLASSDLRAAAASAAARLGRPHVATIRGGALLDAEVAAAGRWRLSPQRGADLARELRRLRAQGDGVTVAGNAMSNAQLAAFEAADWAGGRIVRLDGDPAPADRVIAGPALWRRAEPGNDPALIEALGDDIAHWIATCAA